MQQILGKSSMQHENICISYLYKDVKLQIYTLLLWFMELLDFYSKNTIILDSIKHEFSSFSLIKIYQLMSNLQKNWKDSAKHE